MSGRAWSGSDREPLLRKITAACDELELRWCHFPDSRRAGGHRGFVDLVILGRGALFREVKEASRMSRAQLGWSRALDAAGLDAGVWTWDDWPDRITAELRAIAR